MATAKASTKVDNLDGLDADDIWGDLITDNAVPPMKVKGIVLTQPTKAQVDLWRLATTAEEGERALFAGNYDAIHGLFKDQPEYIWENFNLKYLKHMFGTGDDAELGK